MGIRIQSNSRKRATSKLLNQLTSYLFEEEFGELKDASYSQKEALKEAQRVLSSLL